MGAIPYPPVEVNAAYYLIHPDRTEAQNLASLQEALAALPSGRGGTVVIPEAPADYFCAALPNLASGQVIRGQGRSSTRLRISDSATDGLTILGANANMTTVQAGIEDLAIIGPGTGTGAGLRVKWGSFGLSFRRLHIYGFGYNVWWEDSYSATFEDCEFDSAVIANFHGLTNVNQMLWSRCIFINAGEKNVSVVGGVAGKFLTCTFESAVGSAVDLRYCTGYDLDHCNYENNGQDGTSPVVYFGQRNSGEACQLSGISGGNISGSGVSTVGVEMDHSVGCYVDGLSMSNIVDTELVFTGNAVLPRHSNVIADTDSGRPRVTNNSPSLSGFGIRKDDSTPALAISPGLLFEPQASQPSIVPEGLVWYDGATHGLRLRGQSSSRFVHSGGLGQATIDFPEIAAHACAERTISTTGAQAGDRVIVSAPAALEDGLIAYGRVTAPDVVTVRLCNVTDAPINPAPGAYQVNTVK